MSKNTIVFEGGIDNIRTLADNSLRVSLGTPELTSEIVGNMYSTQRLRNTLYVLWEQTQPKETSADGTTVYVDFDLFYKRKMNELIRFIKDKLV
jgi:hypothetical protein